jgi:hypothetical protein
MPARRATINIIRHREDSRGALEFLVHAELATGTAKLAWVYPEEAIEDTIKYLRLVGTALSLSDKLTDRREANKLLNYRKQLVIEPENELFARPTKKEMQRITVPQVNTEPQLVRKELENEAELKHDTIVLDDTTETKAQQETIMLDDTPEPEYADNEPTFHHPPEQEQDLRVLEISSYWPSTQTRLESTPTKKRPRHNQERCVDQDCKGHHQTSPRYSEPSSSGTDPEFSALGQC